MVSRTDSRLPARVRSAANELPIDVSRLRSTYKGRTVRTTEPRVQHEVPMFLTDEELEQLTGTKRPSKMIKWLRAEGFTFRVDRNGWPVVSADHVKQVLCGTASPKRRKAEVNLDWVKEKGNGASTTTS